MMNNLYMMLAGLVFWFLLGWSRAKNRKKSTLAYLRDQDDEMIVSLAGGLIFWYWSCETLAALDFTLEFFNMRDPDSPPTEMKSFFYLLVGPIIEKIYSLTKKK